MQLIPAIDLSQGQVVRLRRGDMAEKTIYSDDPGAVAASFREAGADLIHVVDLDGAFEGEPRNDAAIRAICAQGGIPVEVGGGLRSLEAIRAKLELGAGRCVLGTAAAKDPELLRAAIAEFGPEAIVGGLDVRDGKVAVEGWVETEGDPEEVGQRFREAGLRVALHTEVSRDGVGGGPAVDASVALARATGLRIIVSGGVSSMDHVRAVAECGEPLIEGLIIGRAIYEGQVDLAKACRIARRAKGRQ
jgi:phosphoribosylformimino-5-aminoimidazole carboxamide ribotide isomerase